MVSIERHFRNEKILFTYRFFYILLFLLSLLNVGGEGGCVLRYLLILMPILLLFIGKLQSGSLKIVISINFFWLGIISHDVVHTKKIKEEFLIKFIHMIQEVFMVEKNLILFFFIRQKYIQWEYKIVFLITSLLLLCKLPKIGINSPDCHYFYLVGNHKTKKKTILL